MEPTYTIHKLSLYPDDQKENGIKVIGIHIPSGSETGLEPLAEKRFTPLFVSSDAPQDPHFKPVTSTHNFLLGMKKKYTPFGFKVTQLSNGTYQLCYKDLPTYIFIEDKDNIIFSVNEAYKFISVEKNELFFSHPLSNSLSPHLVQDILKSLLSSSDSASPEPKKRGRPPKSAASASNSPKPTVTSNLNTNISMITTPEVAVIETPVIETAVIETSIELHDAAPVEQEEAPVEQEEVPVEQEEVPVEQEEVPVEQEEVPVEQEEVPVEQEEEAPVEQEEEPVEQEEEPVEQEEEPVEQEKEAPVEQEEEPVEQKEEDENLGDESQDEDGQPDSLSTVTGSDLQSAPKKRGRKKGSTNKKRIDLSAILNIPPPVFPVESKPKQESEPEPEPEPTPILEEITEEELEREAQEEATIEIPEVCVDKEVIMEEVRSYMPNSASAPTPVRSAPVPTPTPTSTPTPTPASSVILPILYQGRQYQTRTLLLENTLNYDLARGYLYEVPVANYLFPQNQKTDCAILIDDKKVYLANINHQKYALIKTSPNTLLYQNLSSNRMETTTVGSNIVLGNITYQLIINPVIQKMILLPIQASKIYDNKYGLHKTVYVPKIAA